MASHEHIRSLVEGLTAPQPTRAAIQAGVDHAYRLARAYLRTARSHSVIAHVLVCRPDRDLPLDLIADLFETNELGQFVRIRDYFSDPAHWESQAAVDRAWKRLVLGTVSDGLFARYKDADGSLSRIVRNLKRIARTLEEDLELVRYGGRLRIQIKDAPPERLHLPVLLPEYMDPYLRRAMKDGVDLSRVLMEVKSVLTAQTDHAPHFELTTLALLLRSTTVRLHGEAPSSTRETSPDLPATLRRAVARVRKSRYAFYVERERLTGQEYDLMCQAVEIRMVSHAEIGFGHVTSNMLALQELIPDLSEEHYRQHYRSIFEYLFQLVRDELEKSLLKSATPTRR
ncbi:MAG: hypothetical protein RIE53_13315 [Rhodothermales bacterium]